MKPTRSDFVKGKTKKQEKKEKKNRTDRISNPIQAPTQKNPHKTNKGEKTHTQKHKHKRRGSVDRYLLVIEKENDAAAGHRIEGDVEEHASVGDAASAFRRFPLQALLDREAPAWRFRIREGHREDLTIADQLADRYDCEQCPQCEKQLPLVPRQCHVFPGSRCHLPLIICIF